MSIEFNAEIKRLQSEIERLKTQAYERLGRETVANWIMCHPRGYATGHGDTIEDLLFELEAQAYRRGVMDHAGHPLKS